MGSEQSQQANAADANGRMNNQSRLQRGHTIAVTGRRLSSPNDDFAAGQAPPDSRPVSPPISVCSDSDLPYVSYTDKLGGEFFFVSSFLSSVLQINHLEALTVSSSPPCFLFAKLFFVCRLAKAAKQRE